jgi:hypothetical protein
MAGDLKRSTSEIGADLIYHRRCEPATLCYCGYDKDPRASGIKKELTLAFNGLEL